MTLVGSDSVGDARGWGLAALLKDELSLKVICPVLLKTQGALDDADDMAIRRTVLINLHWDGGQLMIGFMIYEMMMRCFDYHQQQESEPPSLLAGTNSIIQNSDCWHFRSCCSVAYTQNHLGIGT